MKFNLNSEQKRAFQIIANHALSGSGDQLKIYLGGMGGREKSQVLKALSYFFETRTNIIYLQLLLQQEVQLLC